MCSRSVPGTDGNMTLVKRIVAGPGGPPLLHTAWCSLWCTRTNIDIDDEVLHEAQRLLGTRTKKETVDLALRELVARHRQIGVLDLRGRVRWEGNLADSRLPRA